MDYLSLIEQAVSEGRLDPSNLSIEVLEGVGFKTKDTSALQDAIDAYLKDGNHIVKKKTGSTSGVKWTKGNEPEEKPIPKTKTYQSTKRDIMPVKKKTYESTEQVEETTALDSLKPHSNDAADPSAISTSRVEMMKKFMQLASGMDTNDLSNLFNSAMSMYGPGKYPAGSSAEQNAATIDSKNGPASKLKDPMPKLNVKEDLDILFEGSDLSAEFKEKATTIFEAAIEARFILESERLFAAFEEAVTEETATMLDSITDRLDAYMNYAVNEWVSDNEVAIVSELKNECVEEFVSALRNVFESHYVDIPTDSVDLTESLIERVAELEEALDRTIMENNELHESVTEVARLTLIDSMTEGLTVPQSEKFFDLAEGISWDGDADKFKKKLEIVKETYFKKGDPKVSNLTEETFEQDESQPSGFVDPSVARVLETLNRRPQ